MKQHEFYSFFAPAAIPNRAAAARAVVAGTVAGGILALAVGIPGLLWALRGDGKAQTGVVLLAVTLILVAVTIGTWKEILSAPIIGMLVGLLAIAWSLSHHLVAAAILLFIPSVGGFWTASRGILALKRLSRVTQ